MKDNTWGQPPFCFWLTGFLPPAGVREGAPVGDPCHGGVGGPGQHRAHLRKQQYYVFLDPGLRHNLHRHVPPTRLCPVLPRLQRLRLRRGPGRRSGAEGAERRANDWVACRSPLPGLHAGEWRIRPARSCSDNLHVVQHVCYFVVLLPSCTDIQ